MAPAPKKSRPQPFRNCSHPSKESPENASVGLQLQVSKTCLVAAQPRWSSTKLPEQRSDDAGSADDMFHPLRCLQDGPVILA